MFPKEKEVFAELINNVHQLLKQNWLEIINGNQKYCDRKNKIQDRVIFFFITSKHSYNRS